MTLDRDFDHNRLTDFINELTRPRTNTEPFALLVDFTELPDGRLAGGKHVNKQHRTDVLSLIDQLETAMLPGQTGGAGARSVPGSRPSARLEAIDMLMRIDQAAARWIDQTGNTIRDSTSANLSALLGIAGSLTAEALHDLMLDAYSWTAWARITTGWDVPPWRPNNSCPLCSQRGGLRVRAGDGITSQDAHALCVHCGEHWDPSTIGLLARHIKSENDDVEETA